MNTVNTVAALRAEVTRKLSALPLLRQVAVLAEDKLNLPTEIAKALAQGKGFCVTVLTGSAKGKSPNLKPAQADVECIVEIAEIPPINRGSTGAQLPSIDATVAVVAELHHFEWCRGRVLVFDEAEFAQNDKIQMQKYTVIFKTDVSFEA